MESKVESTEVFADPQLEAKVGGTEVIVELDQESSAVEIAAELSEENKRLKQKVERLQAMLLGSPAQESAGPGIVPVRKRRLSAPTRFPAPSAEEDSVQVSFCKMKPSRPSVVPQVNCNPAPSRPSVTRRPSVTGRPSRPSVVPRVDCNSLDVRPSRGSLTPRVECGSEDDEFGSDANGGLHSDADSGSDAFTFGQPLSPSSAEQLSEGTTSPWAVSPRRQHAQCAQHTQQPDELSPHPREGGACGVAQCVLM